MLQILFIYILVVILHWRYWSLYSAEQTVLFQGLSSYKSKKLPELRKLKASRDIAPYVDALIKSYGMNIMYPKIKNRNYVKHILTIAILALIVVTFVNNAAIVSLGILVALYIGILLLTGIQSNTTNGRSWKPTLEDTSKIDVDRALKTLNLDKSALNSFDDLLESQVIPNTPLL